MRRRPLVLSVAPLPLGGLAAAAVVGVTGAHAHPVERSLSEPAAARSPERFAAALTFLHLDSPSPTASVAVRPSQPATVDRRTLQMPVATTIPPRVLAAYVTAATRADAATPDCHLQWQLLAGIGLIESAHAQGGGSLRPGWTGESTPPIYGPMLDGTAGVAFTDSDEGALDGSRQWDRAVGPMQFLPSTWAMYGADGNGDGRRDPQQIDDATLAAADYLCAVTPNLDQPAARVRAVFAYNHSDDYVRAVLTAAATYAGVDPAAEGVSLLPDDPATETSGTSSGAIGGATPAPSATPTLSVTGMPSTTPSPSTGPTTAGATPSAEPSSTVTSPPPSMSPDTSLSPSSSATPSDSASAS